ncbi:MAG: helix-turn-helix domain-containing protein [Clostridiales bacterium]|nr:helix-turn-helix domain-containing protein [Clostridiales bacterium]
MIERAEHKTGYTVIDNRVIRDGRLSLKARFLLIMMLSLADGWRFSVRGLAQFTGMGIRSVTTLLKELMGYGYVTFQQERREDGTFGRGQYTVHEIPVPVNADTGEAPERENTCTGKTPDTEKPDTGKAPEWETACTGQTPDTEKHHTGRIPDAATAEPGEIDTLRNNKELKNTKRERAKPASPPTVEEVRAYCREQGYAIDPEGFVDYYQARGWMLGNTRMRDWRAALRSWARRERVKPPEQPSGQRDEWEVTDPSTWRI